MSAGGGRSARLVILCFAALFMAVGFGVTGCTTLFLAPADQQGTSAQPPALQPPQPSTLRRILEQGSTFRYTFNRLSDADVKAIVEALPESAEPLKNLKKDLLSAETPAGVKQALLKLGEDSVFASGVPRAADSRGALITALPEPTLQRLAVAFVEFEHDRSIFCAGRRPRIHNIGIQNIITFERKTPSAREGPQERAVRIPVDGRDLHPYCVTFDVTITGTVPLSRGYPPPPDGGRRDFFLYGPTDDRPDFADILLLEPFIDRLKTGDQVTIQISVSQRDAYGRLDKKRLVSFAVRTFALYEIEDYRRRILESRIAPHDIRAFPLPEQDAELLFGSLVAREFFVVRLSVRNTESEAKLISTGMITAYGRAIVEPVGDEPSFTVPVMVVPSSLQQTFTILDDEEANQPRAWTFRALEFVGALTSAATSAFGFSLDVSKGVSLFTGVGIPEGKRLFPDRWPGYKRNVVIYGMPDLIKVPANAVTDHRFLFFPKKDIELVIADHNMFTGFAETLGGDRKIVEQLDRTSRYFFGKNIASVAPKVRVISLAFDNLDIRFEKVFEVKAGTRDEITRLLGEVPRAIDAMASIQGWTESPSLQSTPLASGITEGRRQEIKKLIDAARGAQKGNADSLAVLELVADVTNALAPDRVGKELLEDPELSLDRLKRLNDRVTEINRQIAGGVDPERYADEVRTIREALQVAVGTREFLIRAARTVMDVEVERHLKALESRATIPQQEQALNALLVRLDELRLARSGTKAMPRVELERVVELRKKIAEKKAKKE